MIDWRKRKCRYEWARKWKKTSCNVSSKNVNNIGWLLVRMLLFFLFFSKHPSSRVMRRNKYWKNYNRSRTDCIMIDYVCAKNASIHTRTPVWLPITCAMQAYPGALEAAVSNIVGLVSYTHTQFLNCECCACSIRKPENPFAHVALRSVRLGWLTITSARCFFSCHRIVDGTVTNRENEERNIRVTSAISIINTFMLWNINKILQFNTTSSSSNNNWNSNKSSFLIKLNVIKIY